MKDHLNPTNILLTVVLSISAWTLHTVLDGVRIAAISAAKIEQHDSTLFELKTKLASIESRQQAIELELAKLNR